MMNKMDPALLEPLTVAGLVFEHGQNDTFEWYRYVGAHRWSWETARFVIGDHQDYWQVFVSEPGIRGRTVCLTSTSRNADGSRDEGVLVKQARADYQQPVPLTLLAAVARLVQAGTWPEVRHIAAKPAKPKLTAVLP